MRIKKITTIVLFIILTAPCLAQTGRPAEPETTFRLGPGLLITDKAHKGGDTRVLPIPAISYQRGRFMVFGTQARWVFYYEEGLMISALGKLRLEGYRSSESRHLSGMDKRRMTLEGGLAVAQEFDWGRLTAEWTSDVLNEHKGHELRLVADRRFADIFGFDKLAFTPAVGGNWRSKQLNNYYYGVKSKEARPDRDAYTVGDTLGLLTAARLDYALSERWNLFGAVSVEWLSSKISDSPIVDQHHRMSIFIGGMYTF